MITLEAGKRYWITERGQKRRKHVQVLRLSRAGWVDYWPVSARGDTYGYRPRITMVAAIRKIEPD